jgi:hypothetical protein
MRNMLKDTWLIDHKRIDQSPRIKMAMDIHYPRARE